MRSSGIIIFALNHYCIDQVPGNLMSFHCMKMIKPERLKTSIFGCRKSDVFKTFYAMVICCKKAIKKGATFFAAP